MKKLLQNLKNPKGFLGNVFQLIFLFGNIRGNWTVVREVLRSRPENILEIGHGPGFVLFCISLFSSSLKRFTGIEISQNSHIWAKRLLSVFRNKTKRFFLEDGHKSILDAITKGRYDVIIGCHVAYFWSERLKGYIQKIYIALKPGGRLILLVSADSHLDSIGSSVFEVRKHDILAALESSAFTEIKKKPILGGKAWIIIATKDGSAFEKDIT